MSSLKMTFSLASLVLLMALVAMPVMAHVPILLMLLRRLVMPFITQ